MSTSDIYRVYRTTARHVAEFRNGWGSAPILWGFLNQKYLGKDRYSMFGDQKDLWALVRDDRVPRCLRIAHAFTFDRSVCPPDRIAELADACDETAKIVAYEQHVNHWADFATTLRAMKCKARQIGVGLSCTSVSDPWIDFKGSDGLWNTFAAVGDSVAELGE